MVLSLFSLIISVVVSMVQPITVDLNPLEMFTAEYLPHRLKQAVPPFHREINRVLADPSASYVLLEAMRAGGKTTLVENWVLWQIAEAAPDDSELQILSRSGDDNGTAIKLMKHVRDELETNEILLNDFGLTRGAAWGQRHVEVIRPGGGRINFYSHGKKSSIRGSRGTVLIDDPQNTDDCESEAILNRDMQWFLTDLLPVILPEQRLLFIGTPISPLSLCSALKEMEDFKVLSFPVEDAFGNSIWPDHFPQEYLEQRKRLMGLDNYYGEYMCEPRVSGNPVFRMEWIKDYDPDSEQFDRLRREGFYIVTGIDKAQSKDTKACNTAMVTVAATLGAVPDIFLLECRADRWSTKEGAEQTVQVFNAFHQNCTVQESDLAKGHGDDAMTEELKALQRLYGIQLNIETVRPTRDKVLRAMAVQSMVQNGQFHINRHDPGHQALLREMMMFTGDGKFLNDRVDALVHALTKIKQLMDRRQTASSSGPKKVLPPGRRHSVTGKV